MGSGVTAFLLDETDDLREFGLFLWLLPVDLQTGRSPVGSEPTSPPQGNSESVQWQLSISGSF